MSGFRVVPGPIGCVPQIEWVSDIHEFIECKDAPSPPPAPDPAATANAQSTANVDTAAAQAALDYVNQNTPYGSTSYEQTGTYTTPSGQSVPTYTQTTSLSPLGNQILTGEQNIAAGIVPYAGTLANQAGASATTPLDFNTPFSSMLNSTPQQLDQNAANAIYQQQASFLDPQWTETQRQLEDSLAKQGIPVGSEAYTNAMTQFNNAKTQAYQSAQNSAIAGGTNAAAQNFNLALAGQQQNIAQQETAQQQPISLLQQLLGASPGTPTQPIVQPGAVPVGGTDVIGATGISTNAANSAYQAQAAQASAGNNAAVGAGVGLAAAGIVAF